MYSLKLAFRSLIYRRKQYSSLFWVFAVGLGISLCAISISTGMIKAMNEKARIYYGGNFAFLHNDSVEDIYMDNYKDYYNKVRSVFPEEADVSYRFDLDARRVTLYFEGNSALQQTIKGCNFENERRLFKNMNFVSGGFENVTGTNGIILSKAVAEKLGVRVGDEITIELKTSRKIRNTGSMIVKGIFLDSSVFGMYTSYVDFDYLKMLHQRSEGYANRIVVNFPGKLISKKEGLKYQKRLEEVFGKENMFPYVEDKDKFLDYKLKPGQSINGLIPLSTNLDEVNVLEKAMNAVITLVIVILALIIITGISSTYKVLIIKRINEIGIFMALGMKKQRIVFDLLIESAFLLAAGLCGALVLCQVFCFILSLFNFSFITSMDMFLIKGNLKPAFDVLKSVAVIGGVIIFTLLAVFRSAWKSIRILPVKAIAASE